MPQSFEEYIKELQKKLPKGTVLDESKRDALKEAFEKGEKINIADFSKAAEEQTPAEQQASTQATTINETVDNTPATNENESSDLNKSWKEEYAQEWQNWGEQNRLEFQDASIPSKGDGICFRFFEGKSKDYAAEINYTSPYNVTIRGNGGKIPDNKYFEKTVSWAVAKGTAIEFGNITSPEFKAKLLAACYKQGNAQIVNGPTEEEIAAWPEELKKMVEDAKAAAQQQAPQQEQQAAPQPDQQAEAPQQEQTPAQKRIAELRQQIQDRHTKLDDATKNGKTLTPEEQKAIEQEGMSAEEIKLRELRGQAKAGDKKAGHELDARRYNTMTDDFKYKRLTKEENGKEVPLTDDNGNYMYEQDDNGKRVKSEAYKAFLRRAGNNLSH